LLFLLQIYVLFRNYQTKLQICAGNATALKSLCDENIIEVIDGNIFIKFLSEQLNEFEDTSKQNSKNAKEGWEKRRKQKGESDRNATASNPQSESDAIRGNEIKENEIKEEKKRKENIFPYQEILEIFNSVCIDLPKVEKLTDKRKQLIKSRVDENSLEILGDVFKKVNESDFLSGRKTDWKASFDWIFNPTNFVKILENNYQNIDKNGKQNSSSTNVQYSDDFKRKIAAGLQS